MIYPVTDRRCPHCHSVMELHTDAQTEREFVVQAPRMMPYVETRLVTVPVCFCTGCEFAFEVVVSRG